MNGVVALTLSHSPRPGPTHILPFCPPPFFVSHPLLRPFLLMSDGQGNIAAIYASFRAQATPSIAGSFGQARRELSRGGSEGLLESYGGLHASFRSELTPEG